VVDPKNGQSLRGSFLSAFPSMSHTIIHHAEIPDEAAERVALGLAVGGVEDEPDSARSTSPGEPANRSRVADILQLLDGTSLPESTTPRVVLNELERERRRLRQAVSMLSAARRRLHEQSLQQESEQQRALNALRQQWAARRRGLEVQLATSAMQKARDELQDERAQMEAEFQQRQLEADRQRERDENEFRRHLELERRQLQLERQRFEAEMQHQREELERQQQQLEADREQWQKESENRQEEADRHCTAMQQQLDETRRKLVQVELALVEERANQSAQRRRWNDERANAESIIRDLLAEIDGLSKPSLEEPQHRQPAAA